MKQVIHIFLKDLRHHWGEAALSIALAVAFAWSEVHQWGQPEWATSGFGGLFNVRFWMNCAEIALPIAWVFLLVRIIQSDSLVGDRQFWITRPLDWKKLLAAKLLFVVAFVNVPLLVLDCYLLAKAGFTPAHYVAGLLWMQLSVILFVLLPFAALATVTRNLGHLLLGLLIITIYMIGVMLLSQYIPSSDFSGPIDPVYSILLVATAAAVVILQYARRQTGHSRVLIAALAGAVLLLLVATPYQAIVAHEFPNTNVGEQRPVALSLLPPIVASRAWSPLGKQEDIEFLLPLAVSGVASGDIIKVDGILIEIEGADKARWNSGWKSPGLTFFPETRKGQVAFTLKKKVMNRFAASPVKASISVAFTVFRDRNPSTFVVPPGPFPLPGLGHCIDSYYGRQIECLVPMKKPASVLLTTEMSQGTCPLLKNEVPATPGELGRRWEQNGGSEPADFLISPIDTVLFWLSSSGGVSSRNAPICPGTPLTISSPQQITRERSSFEFENLHLSDYRMGGEDLHFSISVNTP
jgi:hypothetical protein